MYTHPYSVKVAIELAAAAAEMRIDETVTQPAKGTATITLVGPADRWFAVGVNAKIMFQQPWTIVVNSTSVTERKLGTCGK